MTESGRHDIVIFMKIRFRRAVLVEVEKTRLQENWDHMYQKWDEIKIESFIPHGRMATIKTIEGDLILNVPLDSFESVEDVKKPAVL